MELDGTSPVVVRAKNNYNWNTHQEGLILEIMNPFF